MTAFAIGAAGIASRDEHGEMNLDSSFESAAFSPVGRNAVDERWAVSFGHHP